MSDNNRNVLAGSIVGLVSMLAVVAFLLIGFTFHVWHPTWMVFLAIPAASLLTDITVKRNAVSAVNGVVSLLATAAFLYLVFVYGKWHPSWLVFFAIPIANLLMRILTRSSYESSNSGSSCGCGNCGGNTDSEPKG